MKDHNPSLAQANLRTKANRERLAEQLIKTEGAEAFRPLKMPQEKAGLPPRPFLPFATAFV